MMGLFAKVYYRLFGTKRLSSLERLTLDAWRNSLSINVREILDAQLQEALFAQQ